MFASPNSGKLPLRILAVAIFISGCAISMGAQETPKPRPSPPRTVILPPKMVAGDPATLAVLDSSGRLVSGVVVELSSGQKATTDSTGRALFVASSDAGPMTAKILGQQTKALSTVVPRSVSEAPASGDSTETQLNQFHIAYPKFITLHDRFTIDGAGFNGRAASNHVYLSDQPCLILAASPVSLVVLPGLHIPIGPIAMRINSGRTELGPLPVSAVLLEFTGPAESVNAGSETKLVLRARGTTEPLAIEVRNGSPAVMQLAHGNVQRVQTSGGEQNIAELNMKLLAAGDYIVTARLVP